MTAEQTERVFDEFEQADNTITRKYGGAGLDYRQAVIHINKREYPCMQ
ncbi:MAG: hypothetical protein KAR30_03425 [Gammaproteobacteria bacterium]|nr:hypothetical protein [Gammaproteobacteria bacterium]